MEETNKIYQISEEIGSINTYDINRKPFDPKNIVGEIYNFKNASPLTSAPSEAERIVFKEQIKDETKLFGYSEDKAILIENILDAPDETIDTYKNELQEILRSAQSELKHIVEFKGRVVALDDDIAEITLFEEGRNVTYTNLDPAYLTDAGLSHGDSFILKIVNDHGIEIPVFMPDEEEIERINREIGTKSEETRKQALDSQKDLDELYKFIKSNDPK